MPPSPLSLPDRFRNWYAYERDCNAKTLAMLESVPAEQRSSPAFQRAIDKMAHLIAARQNWLYRLGAWPENPKTFWPTGTTLADLAPRLKAIEEAWTAYLAKLDDTSILREFEFTATNGDRWRWNVLDLLTQVFGHAWYHRGQIATIVKDLGGKAVDTDYIYWCGTPEKLLEAQPSKAS
jgi:uncharacterized damage-inducible protein DinB